MGRSHVGKTIYKGAVEYGKVRAMIGVVMGTIMGIIMIVFGIYELTRKEVQVNGTIIEFLQSPKDDSNHIKVEFMFQQKKYTTMINVGSSKYTNGQSISLEVDPNNPTDAQTEWQSKHVVGSIVLLFGLIIIFGSWLSLWMAEHYEFYAAASGVAGAADMIKQALK